MIGVAAALLAVSKSGLGQVRPARIAYIGGTALDPGTQRYSIDPFRALDPMGKSQRAEDHQGARPDNPTWLLLRLDEEVQ